MGEWSEYFEDFPEENPSNYDANGRLLTADQIAERQRGHAHIAARKIANPNKEINALIQTALERNPIKKI